MLQVKKPAHGQLCCYLAASAEIVHRFVFVSHPLTSVASLKITFERNYGCFKMTSEFSVVDSCKNTRKG